MRLILRRGAPLLSVLALALFAVGCCSPPESVSQLSQKSMELSEAVRQTHLANFKQMDAFIVHAEKQAGTLQGALRDRSVQVQALAVLALRQEVEGLEARVMYSFDNQAAGLRDEFESQLEEKFRALVNPLLQGFIDKERATQTEAARYPADRKLAETLLEQKGKTQQLSKNILDLELQLRDKMEISLKSARAKIRESAQRKQGELRKEISDFSGAGAGAASSLAQILAPREEEAMEAPSVSYDGVRKVFDARRDEVSEALTVQKEGLKSLHEWIHRRNAFELVLEGALAGLKGIANSILPGIVDKFEGAATKLTNNWIKGFSDKVGQVDKDLGKTVGDEMTGQRDKLLSGITTAVKNTITSPAPEKK